MHQSRSLLLCIMCTLGVSLPSALRAQDAAAAYSVRAVHFATPFISPTLAAHYATTARLPLGYDLELDGADRRRREPVAGVDAGLCVVFLPHSSIQMLTCV